MAGEKHVTKMYDGKVELMFQPGRHRYNVSIPSQGIVQQYVPSVTTIVGIKDKSGALTQWAANCATLFVREKTAEHIESVLHSMPPDQRNPSAIMIPQGALDKWLDGARFNFRNVKQAAADIGTMAHEYLHAHMLFVHFGSPQPERPKVTDEMNDEQRSQIRKANNCIDAALGWISEHHVVPVKMESQIYSCQYGYAGTQDWKWKVDGELCNGDFKSSKAIYDEVWLQLAAYKQAEQEMNPGEKIEASWCLKLGKEDGDFEAVRRDNSHFAADLMGFIGLLGCWKWIQIQEGKTLPLALSRSTLRSRRRRRRAGE